MTGSGVFEVLWPQAVIATPANEYCVAGFTTVVQDNIFGQDVSQWLDMVTGRHRRLVAQRPSIDEVKNRDRKRLANGERGISTPV
jgi:hypothetical protein